jgi:hypothetical protein
MGKRNVLKGLVGIVGLAALAVACDSVVGSQKAGTTTGPAPTALGNSIDAQAVVARASTFRQKGFSFTRDRVRLVGTPSERQVLEMTGSVEMRYLGKDKLVPALEGQTALMFGRAANQPFAMTDVKSGVGVRVSLQGATDAVAERSGGFLVYRGGHEVGDLIHRVSTQGTEDFFVLEQAPRVASVGYDVALDGAAGLRLVENTLEFLDAKGSPRLRIAPPYIVDAEGTRHSARLAVSGCSVDTHPGAPWGRPVVAPNASVCHVDVRWGHAPVKYPALLDPAWQSASSMAGARSSPAGVDLGNGLVLVAGGFGSVNVLATAELFNPTYGTWAATGSMVTGRVDHTLNVVASGSALAAGGDDGNLTAFSSAELYSVSGGTWAATGSLSGPRSTHAAVTLANGTVLVVGGASDTSTPSALATAELFSGSSWSASGTMSTVRQGHTATLLNNGQVFVAGGYDNASATLTSTDLWSGGAFAAGPALNVGRYGHAAALLGNGTVLLAGGADGAELASSAVYTPGGSVVASGNLSGARKLPTATLMRDGRVLVAGGNVGLQAVTGAVDLFSAGAFTADTSLTTPREGHVAIMMLEGRVLVAGGDNGTASIASAEAWPQPTITATPGNNQVVVNWAGTPGNTDDYVAIAAAGSSPFSIVKFVTTGGAVSGTATITGIPTGNNYVARVFLKNHSWITAETAPFNVAGAITTVSLNPGSTLATPSTIIADFTNMSGSTTDWISIAPQGSADNFYTAFQFTNGTISSPPTVSFSNVLAGTYVLRAYFNNTFTKRAESAPFVITGTGTTIALNNNAGQTDLTTGKIVLTYANMSGSTTDWISLAAPGSADTSYQFFQFVPTVTNGNATFTGVPQGTYVGRAYFNNTYQKHAETPSFTVTGATLPVTLTLNAASTLVHPANIVIDFTGMSGAAGDWISIARTGSPDTAYISYIIPPGGTVNGSVTFPNVAIGPYVARAYFNNNYVKKGQSASFTVQ